MTHRHQRIDLADPVTRHMQRDISSLDADMTVGDALESLQHTQVAEKIVYFYVTDADGRLLGVAPTRRLLMSARHVLVRDICVARVISLPERATILDACELFLQWRFLAFPVVDEEKRLVGVVDALVFADEMFNVAERQSDQDVFQLIGMHVERKRRRSLWTPFRDRFPWLLVNIAGGMLCAALLGLYEEYLDTVILLALFIPVTLSLSESVSMQAVTITLQGFHGDFRSRKHVIYAIRRELLTAFALGGSSGALVGLIAYLWRGQLLVAIAIGGSIALGMITACVLGVALPSAAHALRIDPKIASGPIVLALADVATLVFYFTLARELLF